MRPRPVVTPSDGEKRESAFVRVYREQCKQHSLDIPDTNVLRYAAKRRVRVECEAYKMKHILPLFGAIRMGGHNLKEISLCGTVPVPDPPTEERPAPSDPDAYSSVFNTCHSVHYSVLEDAYRRHGAAPMRLGQPDRDTVPERPAEIKRAGPKTASAKMAARLSQAVRRPPSSTNLPPILEAGAGRRLTSALKQCLPRCKVLSVFALYGIPLSVQQVGVIAKCLRQMMEREEYTSKTGLVLILKDCQLGSEGAKVLLDELCDCPRLRYLCLSGNTVDDTAADSIGRLVKVQQQIQHKGLWMETLHASPTLQDKLMSPYGLRGLDLSHNRLGPQTMRAIRDNVTDGPPYTLNLSYNPLNPLAKYSVGKRSARSSSVPSMLRGRDKPSAPVPGTDKAKKGDSEGAPPAQRKDIDLGLIGIDDPSLLPASVRRHPVLGILYRNRELTDIRVTHTGLEQLQPDTDADGRAASVPPRVGRAMVTPREDDAPPTLSTDMGGVQPPPPSPTRPKEEPVEAPPTVLDLVKERERRNRLASEKRVCKFNSRSVEKDTKKAGEERERRERGRAALEFRIALARDPIRAIATAQNPVRPVGGKISRELAERRRKQYLRKDRQQQRRREKQIVGESRFRATESLPPPAVASDTTVADGEGSGGVSAEAYRGASVPPASVLPMSASSLLAPEPVAGKGREAVTDAVQRGQMHMGRSLDSVSGCVAVPADGDAGSGRGRETGTPFTPTVGVSPHPPRSAFSTYDSVSGPSAAVASPLASGRVTHPSNAVTGVSHTVPVRPAVSVLPDLSSVLSAVGRMDPTERTLLYEELTMGDKADNQARHAEDSVVGRHASRKGTDTKRGGERETSLGREVAPRRSVSRSRSKGRRRNPTVERETGGRGSVGHGGGSRSRGVRRRPSSAGSKVTGKADSKLDRQSRRAAARALQKHRRLAPQPLPLPMPPWRPNSVSIDRDGSRERERDRHSASVVVSASPPPVPRKQVRRARERRRSERDPTSERERVTESDIFRVVAASIARGGTGADTDTLDTDMAQELDRERERARISRKRRSASRGRGRASRGRGRSRSVSVSRRRAVSGMERLTDRKEDREVSTHKMPRAILKTKAKGRRRRKTLQRPASALPPRPKSSSRRSASVTRSQRDIPSTHPVRPRPATGGGRAGKAQKDKVSKTLRVKGVKRGHQARVKEDEIVKGERTLRREKKHARRVKRSKDKPDLSKAQFSMGAGWDTSRPMVGLRQRRWVPKGEDSGRERPREIVTSQDISKCLRRSLFGVPSVETEASHAAPPVDVDHADVAQPSAAEE
ncbi:hypothetical protein KIPB_000565 [Kipferlia bialata]|uniref:Uncharacterized protein n=1 Tax=Kipferlia bialata TaxID=797122 RepID=A0A9K3CNP6_9EUKA|nr:hypothetical protein KIPB_000565 [Kipferlia bialata]|eukprot:g565.t1